jgi:hypothetical protein
MDAILLYPDGAYYLKEKTIAKFTNKMESTSDYSRVKEMRLWKQMIIPPKPASM